jgi:dienelactone hydrolase
MEAVSLVHVNGPTVLEVGRYRRRSERVTADSRRTPRRDGPSLYHVEGVVPAKRVFGEPTALAIRWLRANASRYQIDPARIGVWGTSAGGHLVVLLGTAADQTEWDDAGGSPSDLHRVKTRRRK